MIKTLSGSSSAPHRVTILPLPSPAPGQLYIYPWQCWTGISGLGIRRGWYDTGVGPFLSLPLFPDWLDVTCPMGLKQRATQHQWRTSSPCTEQLKSSPWLLTLHTGYIWSVGIGMEGGMLLIPSTLLQVSTEHWTLYKHSAIKGRARRRRSIITIIITGIPAIVKPQIAAVQSPVPQMERLNRGMLSMRPSKAVSPHVLMGESGSTSHYPHISSPTQVWAASSSP